MELTIVFDDHKIHADYANGVSRGVNLYFETEPGVFSGNAETKLAFTTAATNAGHNMDDYWAITYTGGKQHIEYSNGHINTVVSGNTGLSEYISVMEQWYAILQEELRLEQIPTWDDIRALRDDVLLRSDKIIAWSTETGNTVPSAWTTYRQALRDITTTYGAPTGNTELVVFPTEPSWPNV